jgi:hypothetical protein
MNRTILVCALLLTASVALKAQEANQSSPYQGTSTPPPDDTIVTANSAPAKPPAGQPAAAPAPEQSQAQPQPPAQPATQPAPAPAAKATDPDSEIVTAPPSAATPDAKPAASEPAPKEPTLVKRSYAADPDGDIVHPHAPRPGELPEGTSIRVRLLDQLSTVSSEKGEAFRSRVASDVLQGEHVLIPAGTEIDGRVIEVSSGHPGGHGSMRLRPETLILADGTRYQLRAELTGTPGAKAKVGSEGAVLPNSRLKRDSVEYGGAVGAGAVTGAVVAGPVGAMTGGLIGAGVITAHLLVSHPEATLEAGTAMVFTLSEPLQMTPTGANGN